MLLVCVKMLLFDVVFDYHTLDYSYNNYLLLLITSCAGPGVIYRAEIQCCMHRSLHRASTPVTTTISSYEGKTKRTTILFLCRKSQRSQTNDSVQEYSLQAECKSLGREEPGSPTKRTTVS